MALTRDFRETIRDRAQREPAFRRALLQEAIEQMLAGDIDTGKSMIRNYINATVGFPALAGTVATPAESLMRMFGPKGNPSAKNLFGVIAALQNREGIEFALKARAKRAITC
jgi:DNA-binding phage protein